VNSLPTINSIGNLIISEDATLQTVNFNGVTAGGESQALIVTASSRICHSGWACWGMKGAQ
jgi:acetaldehyde dehydrogenase (acetylating)